MAPNASNSSIPVHQCTVVGIRFLMHDLGPTWYISLAVLNSCFVFPTIFLNLIILIAIRKTPSIHSSSFVLFAGLVLSLLLAATTIEPLFVGFTLTRHFEKWNESCILEAIAKAFSLLLGGFSRGVVMALAFDRFMAVHLDIRYKYVITLKRSIIFLVVNLFLNAVMAVLCMWFPFFIFHVIAIIAGLDLALNSSLYFVIWLALRARTKRIRLDKQGGYSPMMNFFKRSMHTSICIAGASVSCHLPLCASLVVLAIGDITREMQSFEFTAAAFVNLSFFVIPATAVWKMSHLRKAVKTVLDPHLPSFLKLGQNQVLDVNSHNIPLPRSNKPLEPRIEFVYNNKAMTLEMEELRLVNLRNVKKLTKHDVPNTVRLISVRSPSQNLDAIEGSRVYSRIINACAERMTQTACPQSRRHSVPLMRKQHKISPKFKRKVCSLSLDEVPKKRPEGFMIP